MAAPPTEFGEPMQNYILAITEDSDAAPAPDYIETAIRRSTLLDPQGAADCAQFFAQRLSFPSVPVKIKTLSLLTRVLNEGGPFMTLQMMTHGLAAIQATCSFTCAPDPKYGDKPMKMVQANAQSVLAILQTANTKKLQKAGEKALMAQDKERARNLRKGIDDPDAYDMGPVILGTRQFKGDAAAAFKAYDNIQTGASAVAEPEKWTPPAQQMSQEQIAAVYGGGGDGGGGGGGGGGQPPAQQFAPEPAAAPPQAAAAGLGAPPPGTGPTRGAGGSLADTCADWVLQCTSADEQPAPPEPLKMLTEALTQAPPAELPAIIAHIAARLDSHAVPVRLKALVLTECLVRDVGQMFREACVAHLVPQLEATTQFTCEPDPVYGDKPMNLVRAKAETVKEMVADPIAAAAKAAAGAPTTGETPLATFRVVQDCPYFKNWQKDSKVRGTLAENTIIEVYETRMDTASMKNKARHALGWTPTHAPDGSVVLEQLVDETPVPEWVSDDQKRDEALALVAPTLSFDTVAEFTPEMLEPAIEAAEKQGASSEMILKQVTKMFQGTLDKVVRSLVDGEDAPLKAKLEAKQAEFAPRFAENNPPNISDLLYDIMSSLRSKSEHEAVELAEQALQGGVPLWEAGSSAGKDVYVILEPALEAVAYGSNLPEPHKGKAQGECRKAKGLANDKDFWEAAARLRKLADKLLLDLSTGLISFDGEDRPRDPWEETSTESESEDEN